MKKIVLAATAVATLLGAAGAASAQGYYHRDHDRNWDHRDDRRGDRDHRRWDGRSNWGHRYYGYYGYRPYVSHRVCAWRYGEYRCWYR